MQTELILTVVGDDRPGMVQDAANCVESGRQLVRSRMTRLAGNLLEWFAYRYPRHRPQFWSKNLNRWRHVDSRGARWNAGR